MIMAPHLNTSPTRSNLVPYFHVDYRVRKDRFSKFTTANQVECILQQFYCGAFLGESLASSFSSMMLRFMSAQPLPGFRKEKHPECSQQKILQISQFSNNTATR